MSRSHQDLAFTTHRNRAVIFYPFRSLVEHARIDRLGVHHDGLSQR